MNDAFEWLWRLSAIEETPWLLSGLLIFLAVIIWLQFKRRVDRLVSAIDQMNEVIQSTDGPTAFKQRFAAVFGDLAANPMLGEVWRAYASTIAQNQTNDNSIGYTRRPQETFNEKVVTAAGIDLRFYGSVPNLLVGMGLLFSFVGLVSALYFASIGVASESVDTAQAALGELLSVATFKFITSITGLAASLSFSWGEKRQLYRIQHRLQKLCSSLEARMAPITSESLMLAQLERTKSIENQLGRLSRSVYVRVPEALDEALASELRQALEPLHQAIAKAAHEFNVPNVSMPTAIIQPSSQLDQNSIISALDESSSKTTIEAQRVVELASVAESRIDRAINVLNNSLDRLRGSHKARARTLQETVEQALDRLRDTRQTMRAMHEMLTSDEFDQVSALAAIDEIDRSLVATREHLRLNGYGEQG